MRGCDAYLNPNGDGVQAVVSPSSLHTPSRRVRTKWSEAEEKWLMLWVKNVQLLPSQRIPWKSCVSDIRSSPIAAAVFDPSHVSAIALHEACKRIAKRNGVTVSSLGENIAA